MIFFRRAPAYDPDGEVTWGLRWRIWTSGWNGIVVFLLGTSAFLALWKGPQLQESLRRHQVQRLLDDAARARGEGDLSRAASRLNEAAALLPSHPGTLREMARQLSITRPPSAIECYTQLLKSGQATAGDAVALAHLAFRSGQLPLARAVIAHLEKQGISPGGAAMLSIRAEEQLWNGQWENAVRTARQAVEAPGQREDALQARLLLARLLQDGLAASSLKHVQERLALLAPLIGGRDVASLEALQQMVRLAADPRAAALFKELPEREQWFDEIQTHPLAGPELKIGAWNLRLAGEPARRQAILEDLRQRSLQEPSDPMALEGARWLNTHGASALALDVADLKVASAPGSAASEWLLLRLDALGSLGRWAEVLQGLQEPSVTDLLPSSIQLLFELRAEVEIGKHPDVATAWHAIHRSARTEPLPLQLYVAGYAERAGFKDQAAILYARVLDSNEAQDSQRPGPSRTVRLACHTGLLRVAHAAMSGPELLERLRQFAREFPEIEEAQADWAYWELLLMQKDSERAAELARNLLQKRPELLAYRTLAALAVLRRGRATEAASVYENWQIDWASAGSRFQAVYLAAMQAAGRSDEAAALKLAIDPAGLHAEERKLAGL